MGTGEFNAGGNSAMDEQEQEGSNQARVAKGENEFPSPGLTGSSMPVQ